jgi:hypothetical protein
MEAAISPLDSIASIKDVEMDSSGVFKYVLIKISTTTGSRFLVRGHGWASFHDDIFQHHSKAIRASLGPGIRLR